MNAPIRALTTLLAAGVAGFLLWLAAQFDLRHTGGYWAALGVVAGCGLLLGVAQLRGLGGNPPAMLLGSFLPVLVCAGWVVVAVEPQPNWFRDHVTAWSSDLGILHAVRSVGTFNGVLAFGIGLVFGYALEPAIVARRRRVVEPVGDDTVADEPVAAEREEIDRTATVVR